MSLLERLWYPRGPKVATPPPAAPASHAFQSSAVGSDYPTWLALIAGYGSAGARASRHQARRIPAIQRARNLICGTIGTLPLAAYNARAQQVPHAILAQPESMQGLPRCVTITRTAEDLLYDGVSLWFVQTRDATGFPQAVERVEHGSWQQDKSTGEITVRGRAVRAEDAIVFHSPNDPLLVTGAPAIRAMLAAEAIANLYMETPEAVEFFTSADGEDIDSDEVRTFLQEWQRARNARATAYVPPAFTRNTGARMTPAELMLIDARQFLVSEVARLTGIHATWLSVGVEGTHTYQNSQDERRAFIDFTLGPLLHAIEERLSLGDVTPRGQTVQFDLDAFLRASTLDRYQAYSVALSAGWLSTSEVRALEDMPSTPAPGDASP